MSRMKALWTASPRKVMAGFVGVLAATGIAVGSGANFNSASANPSNTFSAGTISQSNSKAGQAILTASNLKPGGSATGTVTIKNTGSVAGAFVLTQSALTNSDTANPLSAKLNLSIKDETNAVVYTGTITGMGNIALGTWQPNAEHTYTFTVTFPDGGNDGADNAYQGDSTSVTYNFTATA